MYHAAPKVSSNSAASTEAAAMRTFFFVDIIVGCWVFGENWEDWELWESCETATDF